MPDIPLKVLLVDPDQGSSSRLAHVLDKQDSVISVESVRSLDIASKTVARQDINAIYIDPISLGMNHATSFIEGVRTAKPEIVSFFT